MRYNVISNIHNGAGLQRDFGILRWFLTGCGHQVEGIMFDQKPPYPKADVNIWLEILPAPHLGLTAQAFDAAPRNWVIPNPEWWYAEEWDKYLHRIDKVLAKTRDCERIFVRKLGSARVAFIGFESFDLYQPQVERKLASLHMAGKSKTKSTAAVTEAWRRFALPYKLTVVAYKPTIAALCQGIPNVTHIVRVDDEKLSELMNSHLFHVMPSKYEGFGHYIHEAIGCGGLVLTTDAPPTNEFNGIAPELRIPVCEYRPMRSAMSHLVSADSVAETVRTAARLPLERVQQIRKSARAAFLSDREAFRAAFGALL